MKLHDCVLIEICVVIRFNTERKVQLLQWYKIQIQLVVRSTCTSLLCLDAITYIGNKMTKYVIKETFNLKMLRKKIVRH